MLSHNVSTDSFIVFCFQLKHINSVIGHYREKCQLKTLCMFVSADKDHVSSFQMKYMDAVTYDNNLLCAICSACLVFRRKYCYEQWQM